MSKNVEIERKWKMEEFPAHLKEVTVAAQLQAYLSIDPEVRIREIVKAPTQECSYRLTIKGSGDMTRTEVEVEITFNQFASLLKMIPRKPIKKQFRKYELDNGLYLEVSLVDPGTDSEFMYAEIEFPDEETAKAFQAPDYFGEEVTNDKSFKMKNYWKNTRS